MRPPESSASRWMESRFLLLFSLFFASGLAGLVYQVVWARMLTLVIGVSIFAITTVVCTFMAGLALGSYLVGRFGERWGNPLRVYGVMEGLIGVYATLTPWIFDAVRPIYASAFPGLEEVGLNAFRIGLSVLVLLLPTTLMGGTLPILSRAVASRDERTARGVGLLYSVNTFGAVVGCLVAGFILLAEIGIRGSLFLTAALNLGIAVVAVLAGRGTILTPREPATAGPAEFDSRFVLVIFFLTGFAALGYEVLWTRALLVYVRSSTYAFSVVLAVYLLGIAAGSMAVSGLAGRSRRPLVGLALCQLGVAATVTAGLAAFPHINSIAFALIGAERIDSFARGVSLMFAQASTVLLLPTLFMGAMFPFGVAAYHRAARGVGRTVGSLYAVNTAGNIVGSILVGFAGISLFGVRHSMVAMLAINLLVAAAILARLARPPALRLLWLAGGVTALAIIQLSVSDQIFYQSLVEHPEQRIIYYREGASDTVAVIEHDRQDKPRTLIYSDGRGAAGTWTLQWNLYFGHLPMVLHPDPREVLHICFGSGNSVLALTRHDPERIDAVELSPHVRDAARFFWTNEDVLSDPRVNLVIEDGRNFLLRTDRSYDVVSLEPPQIHTAGVVNLYTQEFYDLVRQHLKAGGIMVQWLPTNTFSESDRAHLIRAFTNVFPFVYVWQQLESPQLLLMGTLEPLVVKLKEVSRRLSGDSIRRDLTVMRTPTAERFLSFFLLGNESTRRLVSDYEPVRDDRTIVDYSIPRYVGSAFGLSYSYPFGPEGFDLSTLTRKRLDEYRSWRDSMSTIIPDAEEAARVERVRGAIVPARTP